MQTENVSPKSNFPVMTQEDREAMLELAREAMSKKVELSKAWKHDWKDQGLWSFLRQKAKLRACPSYIHCSEVKYIKRALKVVGKDLDWYKEHFFEGPLSTFSKKNPNVPMYALQGLILEAAYPELVQEYGATTNTNDLL